MTTFDDKNKTVADKAGNSKQADSTGYIILFFFIGLVASLVLGWVIYPNLLYSKKSQPIDFNHALHMEEVDNGCESCHFFRQDGTFSGAPMLQQCIECHEEPMGETIEELKFVEEFVSKQREVPWLIYSKQPDCVFFSHAAHVLAGKMDCVSCHGHIGESESLKPYQANRITGYSRDIWGTNIGGFKRNSWDRMKMDDCSECHVRENVRQASVQTKKGGCFVCHK
ncbi:MAG: cytochrome c3 family protein [Deltaproteobacteria bacterium]|nr:cytochrome c3 family protein [Deltaproteobacteria bacterium]MBW2591748.1 cytochrome c3 family protein [Deltaproteobacteria bacterium]